MTTAEVHHIRAENPAEAVTVADDHIVVHHLTVADPEAIRLVSTAKPAERPDVMQRIISVGARGMTTMSIGIDVDTIGARVQSVVANAADEAERTITAILESGRQTIGEEFDPEKRSSIMARSLAEFGTWRDEFLKTLDPGLDGSVATELIERIHALVGPDGALEQRLAAALDIDADGSALARLSATVEAGFADLRRDVARGQGADQARAEEAERGTAHGIAFEDVVEAHLRDWAGHIKGTVVERTTTTSGELGTSSRVGDFVVTLASGHRIVVEAKRHATIALTGQDGILDELDRAMANRRAHAAICIAGRDAFPEEVGSFNVYGTRVLTVDEGDGAMTAVALQWATVAATRDPGAADLDSTAVADRLDRIRKGSESLKGARRSITTIRSSLDKLHDLLGELRSDLLDQVGDLDRLLAHAESLGANDSGS